MIMFHVNLQGNRSVGEILFQFGQILLNISNPWFSFFGRFHGRKGDLTDLKKNCRIRKGSNENSGLHFLPLDFWGENKT